MKLFKYCICIIMLSSIFFVSSCKKKTKTTTAQTNATAKPPVLAIEGMIVSTQSLSSDIEVPGTVLAGETTEIHPEISGRLVILNVREGTYVGRGALLAKLYDGDLQAQLNKIQVQLRIAQQTENRMAELLKIQGISRQDYDLTLLQVNNLQADMAIIRTSISKTEIRAPFSGKLGLRNVSPGAYVTPAVSLTTLSQVDNLKIEFNVPEKYGSQLKTGQYINFTVDGTSKNYTANIIATEVMIEENTRSLAIRALVKNSDRGLIPGAFAKVKLSLGQDANAIMIPNSSVLPQGRKKLTYLFKGGKAVQTDITTGVRDSTNIQVLSGVNPGDTVITTGLLFLRPGIDVRVTKVMKAD